MVTKFLRRTWLNLKIAFADNYTSEGFEKTDQKLVLPENLQTLDPQMKRKLTICNLFANQNLSIRQIARVLDASPKQVVLTLIEYNLIKERRRKNRLGAKVQSPPVSTQPAEKTEREMVSQETSKPARSALVTLGNLDMPSDQKPKAFAASASDPEQSR